MKRPQLHIWTTLYFFLNAIPFLLLCLWAIKDGWFPSEKVLMKHPESDSEFYIFNQTMAYFCGTMAILSTLPAWIVILGKRKPGIWITVLIFIALGIPNNPLIGIPILILWIKDYNKAYYGKLN